MRCILRRNLSVKGESWQAEATSKAVIIGSDRSDPAWITGWYATSHRLPLPWSDRPVNSTGSQSKTRAAFSGTGCPDVAFVNGGPACSPSCRMSLTESYSMTVADSRMLYGISIPSFWAAFAFRKNFGSGSTLTGTSLTALLFFRTSTTDLASI